MHRVDKTIRYLDGWLSPFGKTCPSFAAEAINSVALWEQAFYCAINDLNERATSSRNDHEYSILLGE